MKETSKASKRRLREKIFQKAFSGKGIDIGSGSDLLDKNVWKNIESIEPFDWQDGDAQRITEYRKKEQYDFVYSSNCIEHIEDPFLALKEWYSLVKEGGYLIFTVPDEDLYEQQVFPSQWNVDHLNTFTIYKERSWSPRSVNIFDLVKSLGDCDICKIQLVDSNYDYSKKYIDQTAKEKKKGVEACIEVVVRKCQKREEFKIGYRHSGARGDVIYGLPALQKMERGPLYINLVKDHYLGTSITTKDFEEFAKLLKTQDYIDEVLPWNGEPISCNLDVFRDIPSNINHLAICYLRRFDIKFDLSKPWLNGIEPVHKADIIINRSPRYHGTLEWGRLRPLQDRCLFLGFKNEYEQFKKETGLTDIPRYTTRSYIELAQIINGAKLFIGNQSFCFALAEAMKCPRVLEVCKNCPNCDPQSDNGFIYLSDEIIQKYVFGKRVKIANSKKHRTSHTYYLGLNRPRLLVKDPSPFSTLPGHQLLSVIIPTTACTPGKTAKYINSVITAIENYEVIVVCNSPNKSNAEELKNLLLEGSEFVYVPEYIGMRGACNIGVGSADGDYICIMHDDVFVGPGWFEGFLKEFARDDKMGQVGISMIFESFPLIESICFMTSRRVYEHMGLFSRDMKPFGYEDADFSLRLFHAGYKAKQIVENEIDHDDDPSDLEEISGQINESIEYNRKYLIDKFGVKL